MREVEAQLRKAGSNVMVSMWGRAEVRELCNVLLPNEQIKQCLNGHYEGGFALLCATDMRILLIDRKPMFLTLEDVRYDMISEIHYSHRLLNSTARIFTPTKSLIFTSWNTTSLRKLVMDAQQHVMAIRQYQQRANSSFQQQTMKQPSGQQLSPAPQFEPTTQPPIEMSQLTQMTPLTMPDPTEQISQAQPEMPGEFQDQVAMTPAEAIELNSRQPQRSTGTNVMNPFLSAPLITQDRGFWRR